MGALKGAPILHSVCWTGGSTGLRMLTKTSETAIQILLYLERQGTADPVPPILMAERLGASPSYAAKVCTTLAKAGLLRTHHGTRGGVTLARPPREITLLAVVEACQGKVLGDYCQEYDRTEWVCAFHAAMQDLHNAVVGTLQRWTLADLAAKPGPSPEIADKVQCRLGCVVRALEAGSGPPHRTGGA